jgi:omega-6 fatty acid desaturase (delta-12 desaturase)
MNPTPTLHTRTKAFAKDNSLKSWWCILSTLFLLAAALGGTFPALPLAVRIGCSLLASLLFVRFFVIYHDHQHRSILPRSKMAELLMRLFGIWVLCPSTVWRANHDYHHAHNSLLRGVPIGSYPVMTKEQYQKSSSVDRFSYLFSRHPLVMLSGYVSVFFISMVVIPLVRSPRKHYDCLLALMLHLALGTFLVVMFGWLALMLTLILPLSIASAIGAYLFYAQHTFPGVVLKEKGGWTYEGAALESSSHLKTGPIMSWFTGNIGYHHIHHLNHRIPFYRLPEVYRAVPELREAKTTSLKPGDILRCLRMKVWCVETQCMVGVRGL